MENSDQQLSKKEELKPLLFYIFLLSLVFFPFTTLMGITDISFANMIIISRLKIWLGLIILYFYSKKIEKRDFLLWKEKSYSFLVYIGSIFTTYLVVLICVTTIGFALKVLHFNMVSSLFDKFFKVIKNDFGMLSFICITAGITEELLFRGYLIPRLERYFNSTKIAIILSSSVFALIHINYGTVVQIIGPFVIGLLFALHYNKYRNIKILIICHFLWDFITLYIRSKYS